MDYSLWKQGRDGSGQIVSMTPHSCPGTGTSLGGLDLPLKALNVIAKFGIWYEKHQMRKLSEAAFEERRHKWLNSILQQWIDEHRERPGIQIDVTKAVATEAEKLFEKLAEQDRMDLPQILLLKADRLSEYFDQVATFWADVLENLVEKSNSHEDWVWEAESSDSAARSLTEQMNDNASRGLKEVAMGAFGIGMFIVPGGAILAGAFGGGALGALFDEEMNRWELKKRAECGQEYPQLLRLIIAAEQLADVATLYTWFMQGQNHMQEADLFAAEQKGQLELVLAKEEDPWFKRLFFPADAAPTVNSVPSPVEESPE